MYSSQQSALTAGARPASQTEEFCKSISNEIAQLHEKINNMDCILQRYKSEPQAPNDRGEHKTLAPPDRLSEFSNIHSEVRHANERLLFLIKKMEELL